MLFEVAGNSSILTHERCGEHSQGELAGLGASLWIEARCSMAQASRFGFHLEQDIAEVLVQPRHLLVNR